MSRRIALLLSATATLIISTPAFADPECFGAACRMTPQALMPRVEDPPRIGGESVAMDATGNLVDVMPPAIKAPPGAVADVVSEPDPVPVASAPPVPAPPPMVTVDSVPVTPPPARAAEAPAPGRFAGPPVQEPEVHVVVAPPPVRPQPQMVVDPVTPPPARPEPRYTRDAGPRTAPAPRLAEPAARPVRQVVRETTRPAPVRSARVASPEAEREIDDSRAEVTAAVPAPRERAMAARSPQRAEPRQAPEEVITVSPQIHVGGNVVVVSHPNAYDPAWRRCQIDPHGRRVGADCGPASYHPYGAGGYRPYGTYRAYGTAPSYIAVAPDPRIISIARGD